MTAKYIYRNKFFWGILLAIYIGIFSISHVQIYSTHNYGVIVGVMEPVWHLALRNMDIIDGSNFNQYGSSWAPILDQLPYAIAFCAVLTLVILAITFCIQGGIDTLRQKTKGAT
jgi:hypothetical protein